MLSTGTTASEPVAWLTYGAGPVHDAVRGPGWRRFGRGSVGQLLRRLSRQLTRRPAGQFGGEGAAGVLRTADVHRRLIKARVIGPGADPGAASAGRSAPAGHWATIPRRWVPGAPHPRGRGCPGLPDPGGPSARTLCRGA